MITIECTFICDICQSTKVTASLSLGSVSSGIIGKLPHGLVEMWYKETHPRSSLRTSKLACLHCYQNRKGTTEILPDGGERIYD